ncbi:ABC transporter permease [Thiohalorhabdus methylotrophus]|uniref:Transport permease protein n=1 Tax=Thiohalorhabdus methylotrophus TaxID=3242694 RepID=A0ABV4TWY9_9GAMM
MEFNVMGFYTLLRKEVMRFWKVGVQTVFSPMVTTLLYLLIFSYVLEDRVNVYAGVSYTEFLVPGLMMMSMIQNAFANSSSSLIQSKVTGNMVFILLPPLSSLEFYLAFVLAASLRGILVGLSVYVVALAFVDLPLNNVGAILLFGVLASAVMGAFGVIAGIWAEKFDQIAAFTNFFVMPLSFLSGVFYSINDLPGFWRTVSHLNPFFYMIDGFRAGFIGHSDVSLAFSVSFVLGFLVLLSTLALRMLVTGYKMRG